MNFFDFLAIFEHLQFFNLHNFGIFTIFDFTILENSFTIFELFRFFVIFDFLQFSIFFAIFELLHFFYLHNFGFHNFGIFQFLNVLDSLYFWTFAIFCNVRLFGLFTIFWTFTIFESLQFLTFISKKMKTYEIYLL